MNTNSDYKTQGYSAESLAMLESEEGQLNAIFACYGSAAQHGQFFEESLGKLIVVLNSLSGNDASSDSVRMKTIGQLLNHFMKRFVEEIEDWVPEFLDEAREERNFLIHVFFLERKDKFSDKAGRFGLLNELSAIEEKLRVATTLTNAIRIAVSETMEGNRDDKPSPDEVVFSVELALSKRPN